MNLYHFTLARYLDSIRELGLLPVAEKARRGLYPDGYRPMPEVFDGENELVWLTRRADAYAGLSSSIERPARITLVDFVGARHWKAAADAYACPAWWREGLAAAGLKLSPANRDTDWYVVRGCVPPEALGEFELL